MHTARFSLLTIFVGFLFLQIAAFVTVSHKMWPEDLQSIIIKILAIYSVHISVILGGIFAQPQLPADAPAAQLAWAAIVLALLWNSLLVWRSLSFSLATQDSVSELLKYFDGVAWASSFLVTGSLAFFFTKNAPTPQRVN